MPRSDLLMGFHMNPGQPLANLEDWGVEILEHSIDRRNFNLSPTVTFKYRIPIKGLKLEFCIGPHLNTRKEGGRYMFARFISSGSNDFYVGEQTITGIDAFSVQGFIMTKELTAEKILASQKVFHKFNIEFNSKGIEIEDFCEEEGGYRITLDISSSYKLELIKTEDDIAYFKYSKPSTNGHQLVNFRLPKSVKNVNIQ